MDATISGPQESREFQQNSTRRLLRLWYLEMALVVTAIVVVSAIIAILINFDGRELPHWPYTINLNTLVALLTLCLRTTVLVVSAEIIGQSKWIWFADGARQLSSFQIFDEASRGGLLGSIKLLSLLRLGYGGSPLAAVACMTATVSLAIGPFTQQAIKTVSCTRYGQRNMASFPVAMYVPGVDGVSHSDLGMGRFNPGSSTRDALVSSILLPAVSAIQPTCSTGNCSFPKPYGVSHSTIGLCARCLDTTSLLKHIPYSLNTTAERGGNGKDMAYNTSLGDMTIGSPRQGPKFMIRTSNLSFAEFMLPPEFKYVTEQACANVSILTLSHDRKNEPCSSSKAYGPECAIATSCTLYPCMKDIEVDVINGQVEERVVKTVPARAEDPRNESMPLHAVKSPCVVDGKVYETQNLSMVPMDERKRTFFKVTTTAYHEPVMVPSDCLYTMSGPYRYALASFMSRHLFTGHCTADGVSAEAHGNINCKSWWLRRMYNGGFASYESLDAIIQQVATAMTNFFRVDGFGTMQTDDMHGYPGSQGLQGEGLQGEGFQEEGLQGDDAPTNKGFVRGEAMETTMCVRLDWIWLLLPVMPCVMTTAMLLALMCKNATNRQQPIWKSNMLPLLFLSLGPWQQQQKRQAREDLWAERQDTSACEESLRIQRSVEMQPIVKVRQRRRSQDEAQQKQKSSSGIYPPDLHDMEERARLTVVTLDVASAALRLITGQDRGGPFPHSRK